MANKNVQIVQFGSDILQYFYEELDLQNECVEFRNVKMNEFKERLKKSINCGGATKEIEWIK